MKPGNVRVFPDAASAAAGCGAEVLRLLQDAIETRGRATLAISGGSSPKPMFAFFASSDFQWPRVDLFWVDERCVPPTDPQSNYKLAHDVWLKDVPAETVHRVRTELAPESAARHYAEEIQPFLPLDVIHRGMGSDAHTASLFPGDPQIADRTGLVGVAEQALTRITLLRPILEGARHTVILAAGADKAEPLRSVLLGSEDLMRFPAQIAARAEDRAVWFIDEAAASHLG